MKRPKWVRNEIFNELKLHRQLSMMHFGAEPLGRSWRNRELAPEDFPGLYHACIEEENQLLYRLTVKGEFEWLLCLEKEEIEAVARMKKFAI